MPGYANEIDPLTKHIGDVGADHALHLRVARGAIYGLLGLIDAGKPTTVRGLLALFRPSQANVKALDQAVSPNGRGPWAQAGQLGESPSADPELTVFENLEVMRRLFGASNPAARARLHDLMSQPTDGTPPAS